MSYTDFVLPADWASALINNDYSGLTNTERYDLEHTLMLLGLEAARCVTATSHTFFTYKHDAAWAGIGGAECLTYSFVAR
jgi:hypothetical protein